MSPCSVLQSNTALTHIDGDSDPLRGEIVLHGVEELGGVGVLPEGPYINDVRQTGGLANF